MRLADQINHSATSWEWIKRAHRYIADDLFRHYWRALTAIRTPAAELLATIGYVSPPFDAVWIEWKSGTREVGTAIQYKERDPRTNDGVRWEASCQTRSQDKATGEAYNSNTWGFAVDHLGRLAGLASNTPQTNEFAIFERCVILPVLMTLTFANRSTIAVRRRSERLQRRAIKRRGRELLDYREVLIPRRTVQHQGQPVSHRESPRLHWVSGHWRYNRTVYVYPYLRGDAAKGFCETAYRARAG